MILILLSLISSSVFAKEVHPQTVELLGQAKAMKIGQSSVKTNVFIDKVLESRLPKAYKKESKLIRQTIIANANKYDLDPIFVLAIIAGESSFDPKAKGPVGEIGLMQLRESTAKWMTEEYLKKKWKGSKVLENPYENIRIGTAYLRFLRSRFDKSSHYLGAYNLGPGQMKQALKKKVEPKDYARHVMKRYISFHKQK